MAAAILGGVVCAWIARTATPPKLLAGVVLIIGLLSAIPVLMAAATPAEARTGEVGNLDAMMKAKQPAWVAVANPFVGLTGVLLGGRLRRQTPAMLVEAKVTINGPRASVWAAIADVENAPKIISGILKVEVLERPASGLVGLRWRETRMLFGKPEAVEKWITDAAENESYNTRAESDGFVFQSTIRISEGSGGITLASSHETRAQGIVARLKSLPMFLFKGVVKKALLQDLNDVKAAVEREGSVSA
jgi:hypothetical protein